MYRIIFVNHGNVIVKTGLIILILGDHFHFIYIVAKKIWNNLLEPVGGKSGWAWHNSDNLRCPTRSDPFIGTYLNSQDDFELDEEVKHIGKRAHIARLQ